MKPHCFPQVSSNRYNLQLQLSTNADRMSTAGFFELDSAQMQVVSAQIWVGSTPSLQISLDHSTVRRLLAKVQELMR